MNRGCCARSRYRIRSVRLALVAACALSWACAGGQRPSQDLSAEEKIALAGVERVRVSTNDAGLGAELANRLKQSGEITVVDPSEQSAPELRLRASCGSDFDLFREPIPINAPSSGEGASAEHDRYDSSPGSEPGCEGSVTLYVGGKTAWYESGKAARRRLEDLRSLVDRLADEFLKARAAARKGAAPAAPRSGG